MDNLLVELKNKYITMETVAEAVYHVLYDAIEMGILKPGDRILEAELANTLEISRTPVREATRKLVAEGLAAFSSHGSICVREFSTEEICDYIQAMELMRNITTKEAAERISKIELTRIKKIIDQIDELPTVYEDPEEQARQRFELDEKFHSLICDAAGNHYLTECYNKLARFIRLMFQITGMQEMAKAYNPIADQERKEMYDALMCHDAEEAFRISLVHSQRVFDRLQKISE